MHGNAVRPFCVTAAETLIKLLRVKSLLNQNKNGDD